MNKLLVIPILLYFFSLKTTKSQSDFSNLNKIEVQQLPFTIYPDWSPKNKMRINTGNGFLLQLACSKLREEDEFIALIVQQNDTLKDSEKNLFYSIGTFTKEGIPINTIRIASLNSTYKIYSTISDEDILVYTKWKLQLQGAVSIQSIQLTNKKKFVITKSGAIERKHPSFNDLVKDAIVISIAEKFDKVWEEEFAKSSSKYPVFAISHSSARLLDLDTIQTVYDICGQIKLNPNFVTLLILAENNKVNQSSRNYHLVNFSKEGKKISDIKLLSISSDERYTFIQSEIDSKNIITQYQFTDKETLLENFRIKPNGKIEKIKISIKPPNEN